ncbi:MAG: gluconate 2-dehydrogenase subunit 3 family protein [Bacteroidetes bacterium]|nr:MAG: gluconate 2-dehydrogenase subunit 3 family protein [Bacteroidota bacterium]
MNRRELLQNVSLMLGGTIVGGSIFSLQGCKTDQAVNKLFTQSQVDLMMEIAETILPKTSTPGAKDAKVGDFMSIFVLDCYTPADQAIFLAGLKDVDAQASKKFGASFLKLTAPQRTELLTELDKLQKDHHDKKAGDAPEHYFRMMKQAAVLGFFTSEEGATKALRYIQVPGKYDGNLPYKKGDRAWAT